MSVDFTKIYEQAAIGIALVSIDGHWLRVNRKVCEIVGYEAEELLSLTFQEITHPEDLDKDLELVRQVLSGEISDYWMEKRYFRKDGTITWVGLTVSLVSNDEGLPLHFISVIECIDDRKSIELALKTSESQLLETKRLAGLGNWYWDLSTNEHRWSDEIFDIYQRDKSLAPSDYPSVESYFEPESWAILSTHVEKCLKDGTPYQVDAELKTSDRSKRWITARGEPVYDKGGSLIALRGTVQEISQRKEIERQLIANQQMLSLFVEQAPVALAMFDQEMRYLSTSNQWKIDYQMENRDIIGLSHYEVFPKIPKSWRDVHQQAMNGEYIRHEEDRFEHNSGRISWLRWVCLPWRDASGGIGGILIMTEDITERKIAEQVIWHQANYDPLTLLPNRKLFRELLEREIEHVKRSNGRFWLLFLDLDAFKEINDSMGHYIGDELLIEIGKRVKASLRKSDIIARLGGDEFVIALFDHMEEADVDYVSVNILQSISSSIELNGIEVSVTGSIGIACYPTDGESADDLLRFADQAMYAAKNTGKNRFVHFQPSLQEESERRIQVNTELKYALNNDELELYFQPILNLNTGEVVKAEALIRWNHPTKGLLSPASFIPYAEETRTIQMLGNWVVEQAIRQMKIWSELICDQFQLSVNISPAQFRCVDNNDSRWIERLENSGLDTNRIVVEITEGLMLHTDTHINERLLRLQNAGVDVAIDDFGTGYSSLAYLKDFYIDYLKIDRSFVKDLAHGSRELSITEAIIVMARKLGLKLIAEGIETEQQHQMLVEMGCQFGQGFLFSHPLTAKEFETRFLIGQTK